MSNLIEQIKKKFGVNIGNASLLDNRETIVIPFSPMHNIGLGGGIPQGSWVTMSGKPKTHKTTSCLHFARKCQDAGMEVFYGNVEGRLKKRDVALLDKDRFHIIESTEDKFLTAVDYLSIFEDILKEKKRCLLIIDSVSMLADEKEIEGGIGTSTRGGGAKYMAQFCRNVAGVVPVKNHIVIGILQLMANTSGYGSPFQEKGGNAIAYQADVKMMAKSSELVESNKKIIGANVKWQIGASALDMPPGQEYISCIRYGLGIDEIQEITNMAIDLDLIDKTGAWYTIDDGNKKHKVQGIDKVRDFLEQDPKLYKYILNKVMELCE